MESSSQWELLWTPSIFLLGHSATKVKGLKCPSPFLYKIKKWLVRTSHFFAALGASSSSLFFFLSSCAFLVASSLWFFFFLRSCFFFLASSLFVFFIASICTPFIDAFAFSFEVSYFFYCLCIVLFKWWHCFVWMIVDCWRCSVKMTFFYEQKVIRIGNPYDFFLF